MKKINKLMACALALTLTAGVVSGTAVTGAEYDESGVPAVVETPEAPVEDYAEGDFTVDANGAVTGYTGSEENVVIPDKVAGITVTAIGNNSPGKAPFRYNKTIKTVSIPDTVTNINAYAFQECTGLTQITIPDSVETIEGLAFEGCTQLGTVNLGTENSKLYYIGDRAFKNCTYIPYIKLPKSMRTIYKEAFRGCTKLAVVSFNEGLETIGIRAFAECSDLRKVVLPDSMKTVDEYAFSYCTSLVSVEQPSGIVGGVAFDNCNKLEKVSIGEKVEKIDYYAFRGCTSLVDVEIKGGSYIGNNVFENCSSLKTIDIPASVQSIGQEAFKGCTALESVTLHEGLKKIYDGAFGSASSYYSTYEKYICKKLTSIVFPDSLTSIGNNAFYKIPLATIKFGKGLQTIGEGAFYNNNALTELVLPDKITTINSNSFAYCNGLKTIHFGSNVTTIKENAFAGCTSVKHIVMPDSVAVVESNAFKGCTGLESVVTGKNMTTLQNAVFNGCTELKTLTFPKEIQSFGDTTLSDCTKLHDIYYIGTMEEWDFFMEINYKADFAKRVNDFVIHCIDGVIENGVKTSKTVTDVKISTTPIKTTYFKDEPADVDGGYITVTFSDGTESVIAMTTSMITNFDTSTAGTKTLTVEYGDKSATYDITVEAPTITGITLLSAPTKTEYNIGETLSVTGGKITVEYNDGSSEEADITTAMCTGFDSTTAGEKTITVTYEGKTATFTVTVKDKPAPEEPVVTGITVSTLPTKTTYAIGDTLDVTGGKITVSYSAGKADDIIDITAGMCTGFDSTTAGTKTITVTYEGKTATFTVTVKESGKPDPTEEGTLLEVGAGKTYADITSALADINKAVKKKTADTAYTIKLYGKSVSEKKALAFPAVKVILKGDSVIDVTVPSVSAKGDLVLENVILKTAKGANAAVNAKKALTANNCVFGKTAVTGDASITNCTVGALTAKKSLTIDGGSFESVTASAKSGTTTLNNTVNITKNLTVSNDLVIVGNSTVGGKFTAKAGLNINGFIVKNGK